MAMLLAWELGSHLQGAQRLEVHRHSTGLEHGIVKMTRVDQGLRARSALSSV
jgi:hypothetical protein